MTTLDLSALEPEVVEHLQKVATPAHMAAYMTRNLPPDAKWLPYRHLMYVNEKLVEAITDDDERFVNVAISVRHGKSEIISIYTALWYLGMHPDRQVVIVSYSEDKAKEWGGRTMALFQEFGQPLFGLSVDSNNASKTAWSIAGHKGGLRAVGVNGALTGRAIDLGIIDDPIKNAEEANSEAARNAMWDWYTTTFRTRIMPGGTVIVTMARWSEDDLTGRIEANTDPEEGDPWEYIKMPAIAESPIGADDDWVDEMGRHDGEPLWPEVWPLRRLERIRASVGGEMSSTWMGLYQQNPVSAEGGMFKVTSWQHELDVAGKKGGLRMVRYWDLAATKGRGDWTVGVLMGVDRHNSVYVVDVKRVRENAHKVKQLILETARTDGRDVKIGFEQERAGAGKAQIDDLKRMLLGYSVEGVRPEGSKESRSAPYASAQQGGLVKVPENVSWLNDYIEEHKVFPKGRHDDQVDASAGAFNMLAQAGPASGEMLGDQEAAAIDRMMSLSFGGGGMLAGIR